MLNGITRMLVGTAPTIDTSEIQKVVLDSLKAGVDGMGALLADALPIVMTIIVAMTVVTFGISLFKKFTKKAG